MTVEAVLRILYRGVKGHLNESQASNLVLSLLILGTEPVDADTLKFFARFFTPADYDELVQERVVAHRCGYPLCTRMLRDSKGNLRRIPTASVVNPWSSQYSSRDCFRASVFYQRQLSSEVLTLRKDVAYTPYGNSTYEQGIVLLHELEQLARAENKPLDAVLADLVQAQGSLTAQLDALRIGTEPGTAPEVLDATVGDMAVVEKEVEHHDPPVPGERPDE